MVLFPHLDPSPRPRGSGAGCFGRRRALLLLVPAALLLGLVATTWLGLVEPLAAARLPSFLSFSSLRGGEETLTSTSEASADETSSRLAPVSSSPEAAHASPFSFDLAAALAGGNASAYAAWMAAAPDDWPLARLAVPGTHDTLTHRVDLAVFRCQNAALAEQLAAGVRYLDVRARVQVQPAADPAKQADERRAQAPPQPATQKPPPQPLGIYHGDVYTGYEFAAVAQTVFAFLAAHPSEAVVLRLKEEGAPIRGAVGDPPGPAEEGGDAGGNTTATFLDSFEHYRLRDPRTAPGFARHLFRWNGSAADPNFATVPSRIPTVGELRGKVLLLQEFPYFPVSYASSLSSSPSSAAAAAGVPWYGIPWQLSSALLRVEDDWEIADLAHLDDKWAAVRANLRAAGASAGESPSPSSPLFLSHLSASVGVTPIDAAAGPANRSVEGINDRTGRWLEAGDDLAERADGDRRAPRYTPVGIVMADFPGRRLVDAILRRNAFLTFGDAA